MIARATRKGTSLSFNRIRVGLKQEGLGKAEQGFKVLIESEWD